MFIACRELKDCVNGVPVVYRPGDVIPNFEKWDIHARRAHINLEWVREQRDGEEEPKKVFKVATIEEMEPADKVVAPSCSTCNRSFKSIRALNTHLALAHKKK